MVEETNRGWLATVFSDRIDQAAARLGVGADTLLGLVMAHEIGHLLLGVGLSRRVRRDACRMARLVFSAARWRPMALLAVVKAASASGRVRFLTLGFSDHCKFQCS